MNKKKLKIEFKKNGRGELKKLRKFLVTNQTWLCFKDCEYKKPNSRLCNFIFQIDYSYKSNPTANMLTFQNSYVKEPFEEIYKIYQDFQKNNYQHRNSCKCM